MKVSSQTRSHPQLLSLRQVINRVVRNKVQLMVFLSVVVRKHLFVEDARENSIDLQVPLHVNRVRDIDPDTKQDLYHLDFVSKDYLFNEKTRVVKRYEGKISDNVQKILSEVLESESNLDVDTSLEYNFNGNTRKPFYICTWLTSKSVPEVLDLMVVVV